MNKTIDNFYFKAEEESIGTRLDLFIEKALASQNKHISRSLIQKNIDNSFVNNKNRKKNYKVRKDDLINFVYHNKEDFRLSYTKEERDQDNKLAIDIIYEDDSIIVVNKPKGIVVHPAHGNYSNTLVQLLIGKLSQFNFEQDTRPGIVHRLDKDTTGLILITKTPLAKEILGEAFYKREIKKTYKAIIKGSLLGKGEFNQAIKRDKIRRKTFKTDPDGRDAKTLYNGTKLYKLKKNRYYTAIDINLITGRTHQIRVHLSSAGHPIIGDCIYSRIKEDFERKGLALFANSIFFRHPISKKEMSFQIKTPKHIQDIIDCLEKA